MLRVRQSRRFVQREPALVDPAASGQVLQRMADYHAIAAHRIASGQVVQHHLVSLGYILAQRRAAFRGGARAQPARSGDDGNIVIGVHAQAARGDALHGVSGFV